MSATERRLRESVVEREEERVFGVIGQALLNMLGCEKVCHHRKSG